MTKTTSFFWTDAEQAPQRLQGTVVLYEDRPAYIERVFAGDDGIPRAYLTDKEGKRTTKKLDSPHFKRFRELPKLGWVNLANPKHGAIYMERKARNIASHGLCDRNVGVYQIMMPNYSLDANGRSFTDYMWDEGFARTHAGEFPTLTAILQNIKEGSCIAYSRSFAVYRDSLGLRWLYRGRDRIGIFTGVDTLNLLAKYAFYREEIMADPAFTLNTIKEF
jgi:hypothetical protein